jgi:hypothetical protein
MAGNDPKKPKNHDATTTDDESGSGSGGKSGQIEFRDFIGTGEQRDDLLSYDEKKRLLTAHSTTHEGRVKKQKELRDERKQVKEGNVSKKSYGQGAAAGYTNYPAHPVLKDKAQFSGIDRQTTSVPNDYVADTNDENKNELENSYRLRFAPQIAPKFNPKPIPGK